jgi:hypothetical protein
MVAGETLKPSHVYMASYLSERSLRNTPTVYSVKFSVTLCLDFSRSRCWRLHGLFSWILQPVGSQSIRRSETDSLTEEPGCPITAAGWTRDKPRLQFFHYVTDDCRIAGLTAAALRSKLAKTGNRV